MFHRIEFLLEDSKNSLSNNKNEILINSDVTLYLIYLLLEAKKLRDEFYISHSIILAYNNLKKFLLP